MFIWSVASSILFQSSEMLIETSNGNLGYTSGYLSGERITHTLCQSNNHSQIITPMNAKNFHLYP